MTTQDFILAALSAETPLCILWPFAVRKSSGYGAYSEWNSGAKKNWDVHRYVCLQAHGEPEPGEEAAHRCGKKLCINPRHLYWATSKENTEDAKRHGVLRGPGSRKIPRAHRPFILASSLSHIALARHYEVRPDYIGKIRRATKG